MGRKEMRILTETKEWMSIPLRICKRKAPSRKWNKFEDMCSLFIEDILTRPNICTKSSISYEHEEFEYSYKMYLNGVKNDRPISRLKAMYCVTDCIPDNELINLINLKMKKFLFLMVTLFSAITMSAKDDVTVKSGSLAEVKAAGSSFVYIVWDYSSATLEGKNVDAFLKAKGADWVAGYPQELAEAEAEFAKALGKSKFVNVTTEKDQAQYIITIKVKDFNYGNTAVAVWVGMGAGDAHLNGSVEITKNGSKDAIAVLDADGVPGGGFGNEARRRDAYEELGECLVKLIKKAK